MSEPTPAGYADAETMEAGTMIENLVEGHSYIIVGMGYAPAFGAYYECVHEGEATMNRVSVPAQWIHEDHTFAVKKSVVGPEPITPEADPDESDETDDDSAEPLEDDDDYQPPQRDETGMVETWLKSEDLSPADFSIDETSRDESVIIDPVDPESADLDRWTQVCRSNPRVSWTERFMQAEVAVEDTDLLEAESRT